MSLFYDLTSRWQPGHYIGDAIALPDGARITPNEPPVTFRAREATYLTDCAIHKARITSATAMRREGWDG
jgi:hypothetical protein